MRIQNNSLTMMSNANANQAKGLKLNFDHADSAEKDKKTKNENKAAIQISLRSKFDRMIENIRERIQKVNENEHYDDETKKAKLEELQKQLEEAEKAKASKLSESLLEKEKKAEKNTAQNNSAANTQKNVYGDTLELSLDAKAFIQADNSLKKLENAHSTQVKSEGAARVLTSEIEIDRERGVDTSGKEEELAELNATTENAIADMGKAIGDVNKAVQNISEDADPTAVTRNESQTAEEEKISDTAPNDTEINFGALPQNAQAPSR